MTQQSAENDNKAWGFQGDTASPLILSVSDFVAIFNQTLEYAYPSVVIVGELANFRVSKNKWIYFDLKDEFSSVKFFGTVYTLPGPLEDGMLVQIRGAPRLHPQYGFSVTAQSIQPVGEGSLKRAAALLQAKLEAEGLFDSDRKRSLLYPPRKIGLITSGESAAYVDFVKILSERWGGIYIELADVQVQGEVAPGQITSAIRHFNQQAEIPDILVITRGGGSAEDMAAFNTEQVTRAVAASRIPTLVAIGHEVDISLAELAADQRASTPSNAAQLLVPDKVHMAEVLKTTRLSLGQFLSSLINDSNNLITQQISQLNHIITQYLGRQNQILDAKLELLAAINPSAVLRRGYTIIRSTGGTVIKSKKSVTLSQDVLIEWADGKAKASITSINPKIGYDK